MNYFTVDILTPYAVIAKDIPAESLLIPTVRGQINVLAEHTHIISQLETGHMSIFGGADDPTRSFHITTGICKVLKDKIMILTPAAEEDTGIDLTRAKEALENALEKLKTGDLDDYEFEKFSRKAERARLRIQLSEENNSFKK